MSKAITVIPFLTKTEHILDPHARCSLKDGLGSRNAASDGLELGAAERDRCSHRGGC